MNILQEQFLALLKMALSQEKRVPSLFVDYPVDWNLMYEEACRQSVLGITYPVVETWAKPEFASQLSSPIDFRLLAKWYGYTEQIKKKNKKHNENCVKACAYFKEAGFRTSIMKGQGNARLYPDPFLRSCGDMDLWVEGGFQKVNDWVQSKFPTKKVNELEMDFPLFKDTPIEVHYRPFILRNPLTNNRLQHFFATQSEACFTNYQDLPCIEGMACFTTPVFNLVHQLAHIHLHLFTEGVGLRQVMDYYMVLKDWNTRKSSEGWEKDTQHVLSVVESLGITSFAKAMMWILVAFFWTA